MAFTGTCLVAAFAFLLTWGLLNFFWLGLLRRPALAAALSLAMVVIVVLVARLKHEIISVTAHFLDVRISLRPAGPRLGLLGRLDTLRLRGRTALMGFSACLAGITFISFAQPQA